MDTIAEEISRNNQQWNGVEIKQAPKGKRKKFTPFKVEQHPDEEKKEKTFEEELQEKLRQKYFARKEVDRQKLIETLVYGSEEKARKVKEDLKANIKAIKTRVKHQADIRVNFERMLSHKAATVKRKKTLREGGTVDDVHSDSSESIN